MYTSLNYADWNWEYQQWRNIYSLDKQELYLRGKLLSSLYTTYLDVYHIYHVANHELNRLFSNIDRFFKNSLNDICRIKKKMIYLAWLKYPSDSNNLTLPRTGTVRKWVWNGLKYYQRQWGSSSQKTLPLHYLFLSSLSLSLTSFFCEV